MLHGAETSERSDPNGKNVRLTSGTVAVMREAEITVKAAAAVPLKVTLLVPVKLVPRTLTAAPTLPKRGCVFTSGPKPRDRLKTVP